MRLYFGWRNPETTSTTSAWKLPAAAITMSINRGSIVDGLLVKWSRRKRSPVAWGVRDPASAAGDPLVQQLGRLTSLAGRGPGTGGGPCRADLACAARSFLGSAGFAGSARAGAGTPRARPSARPRATLDTATATTAA